MQILIGFDLDRMSDKLQLAVRYASACRMSDCSRDRQAKAYRTSWPALRARFLHTA